jgi:prepilin signal peptidase PulO-like enzyme (type II secretory pathway)
MTTQTLPERPAANGPHERAAAGRAGGLARRLREHGLTIALLALFVASLAGQSVTGHRVLNDELAEHGRASISFAAYLTSGHFIEAVFENWESEFMQMGAFVLLTVWLRQKGSPESKPLDEKEGEDEHEGGGPAGGGSARVPWPVRRGGLAAAAYSHSLSVALGLLFVASFALHATGGARAHDRQRALHGEPATSVVEYLGTSQFWFESFQNWQSEFVSVAALVVLSIVLRERGSAQSKRVAAPHGETGA